MLVTVAVRQARQARLGKDTVHCGLEKRETDAWLELARGGGSRLGCGLFPGPKVEKDLGLIS